jgi:hypothetical protein
MFPRSVFGSCALVGTGAAVQDWVVGAESGLAGGRADAGRGGDARGGANTAGGGDTGGVLAESLVNLVAEAGGTGSVAGRSVTTVGGVAVG